MRGGGRGRVALPILSPCFICIVFLAHFRNTPATHTHLHDVTIGSVSLWSLEWQGTGVLGRFSLPRLMLGYRNRSVARTGKPPLRELLQPTAILSLPWEGSTSVARRGSYLPIVKGCRIWRSLACHIPYSVVILVALEPSVESGHARHQV
ncbi:hypothetical protein BD309DRAFT_261142 [Dichomitus squalens]|nr:hypothetical protein BD309DRAFT_261142 [Dichomitus squalens]